MKAALFIVAFVLSLSNAHGCWVLDEVDSIEEIDLPIPAEITIDTFSLIGIADSKPVMANVRIRISKELLHSGRYGNVRGVFVKCYAEGADVVREDIESSREVSLREGVIEFTISISELRRSRLCIDSLNVKKFRPCSGGTFIYPLQKKEPTSRHGQLRAADAALRG